jgi:hypothetical protein
MPAFTRGCIPSGTARTDGPGASLMEAGAVEVLVDGCGRGFTALCTIQDAALLAALASAAGATGLVVVAGREPVAGEGWQTIRCEPARAIPVRSHVIDAVVIEASGDLPDVAVEVRRMLVPAGDVRVLLAGGPDVESALAEAAIRPIRRVEGVLIARGP